MHIFALTETHVNKDLDYDTLFEILGFNFLSKPRQNGSGGGGRNIHIKSLNLEEAN